MTLRTVVVAVAATILLCVVAMAGSEPLRESAPEPPAAVPPPPAEQAPAPVEPAPPQSEAPDVSPAPLDDPSDPFDWVKWVIIALLVAAAVAAAWVLLRSWRWGGRRPRVAPSAAAAEEVSDAVAVSPEVAPLAVAAAAVPDAAVPADPRAAVIEAYARMEQVLAARRLGRTAPETPREYLGRVLLERGVPERPLVTLTALFEEARFSLHPIPESAPERAESELSSVRDALGSSP